MKSVLIVDDSKTARMMLKHWLKTFNPEIAILEAGSASEAMEASRSMTANDMAIIDYNMPGENGLELAEKLAAKLPKTRMTLCTANIQEAVRNRAESLGVFYIAKPMTPAKVKKIMELMDTSR